MTTHWLHQILMVGVDKYINSLPKISGTCYSKSASWVSVTFLEAMGRWVMMLASTQETSLDVGWIHTIAKWMWGFGARLQCKETNGMICPNWLHWSGKLPAWATLAPQPLSTTPLLPCIPIPATHPPPHPLHMQRAVHPSELPTAWWNKNVAKNPLMRPHTPTSIPLAWRTCTQFFLLSCSDYVNLEPPFIVSSKL